MISWIMKEEKHTTKVMKDIKSRESKIFATK